MNPSYDIRINQLLKLRISIASISDSESGMPVKILNFSPPSPLPSSAYVAAGCFNYYNT